MSADTVKNVSSAENKEVKEPAKEPQKDEKKTTTDSKPEAKVSEKSGNNGKGKTKADTLPPKMSEAQTSSLHEPFEKKGDLR